MRSFLFTFLFLWLTVLIAPAQQYNFKTWTLENGLPQSEVNSVIQDNTGYLWVGTMGGLSRFNGIKFTNFTKENGLSSNSIRTLFKDKKGNLWIGTYDQGVCFYDGHKFKSYGEKEGVPKGGITSITQAPDQTIWVATSRGIASFKNNKFTLLPDRPDLPAQRYSSILAAKNGELWLGTLGDGLFRYNGRTATHYLLEDGLSNKIIYSLIQLHNGTIWIGTYGGITKFDGKKLTPYKPDGDLNLNRTMAMSEDRFHSLWLALDGGGLLKFDGYRFIPITSENGLTSNYLTSITHDNEGNLWVGSQGSGLQRYTPCAFVYYSRTDGLKNENVTALLREPNADIWVGTFGGGLAYYNNREFKWFGEKEGLPGNIINDLKKDASGNIWLATNKGLSRYDGKHFKNYNQDNGLIFDIVNSCQPTPDNKIWVGTNEGFSIFDGHKFQNFRLPDPKNSNFVECVFRDRQGRCWLGTKAGIYEFSNNKFISYPELQKYELREVCSITQDKYNNLWFASYNRGLLRFSPEAVTDRSDLLTTARGLLTDGIKSLRTDSLNQLWIGSIRGLHRLDLALYQKNHNVKPKVYTIKEGFRGIEINPNAMIEGMGGRMWFGTVKGVVRYLPFYDYVNTQHPTLLLNSISLFLQKTNWKTLNQEVDTRGLPKNLTLKADENYLTFNFEAISLTNPEEVTYTYKLEGFDKTWSRATTEPSATYTNLPPGHFVFQVKACSKQGLCNIKPIRYPVYIVPPFWNKDRVIGISVLLAASLAFGLARWRERNLKRLNAMLEQNVEQRTRLLEKKNHEKEILLKEVHHRVKNNLQIITSLLNLQGRHVSDPAVLHTLREIKDRIKSISMLHQRLYQREELSSIDLSEYVQTLCRSLFASYGVREDHVRLEFDIPTLYLDIDTALTLGLIVNELVSNTLKYAFPEHRKGTLLIELLRVTETDYTLTISDDGTGLPDNFEEKMATSFGLQLVSSLIKKLHGTLKFYSEGGTQIRLQFVILPQQI